MANNDIIAADCWICLESDANEDGELPRRDCSCRGDAGFAHLSCLVTYARTKGADAFEDCPTCKQSYQNELALDLANTHLDGKTSRKRCVS